MIVVHWGYNAPADIGEAKLDLSRVQGGTPVPIEFTTQKADDRILITPASPLVPDSDYALEGTDLCMSGVEKATFHTGATAPLPTRRGCRRRLA